MEKIESKRLLFILNLIKEKLERCICDTIRTLKCEGIISKEEAAFLNDFFDEKFDENNLLYYYISTLEPCSPRYLAYRFTTGEARLTFLNKLIDDETRLAFLE